MFDDLLGLNGEVKPGRDFVEAEMVGIEEERIKRMYCVIDGAN